MNISDVKTARKMGDFALRQNHRNKITITYLPTLTNAELKDNVARVYLITQDGVIKKIGGSASKGGIKATMSFYVSAMTGSPGVPRFVAHLLIEEALIKGSKLELYMITSPMVLAKISGLYDYEEGMIASFKEMEDKCKNDYFLKEGKYPDWNFQENHDDFPDTYAKRHNEYHKERLANKVTS